MTMQASAARYAKALFDVAIKEADPVAAEKDLAVFVGLVAENPELQRTFGNPVISASAKRAVVEQIVNRLQPSAPVGKLLLLLASRGRLELLVPMLAIYRQRLMEHQQVVEAEITTAAPLASEQAAQLQQRLSSITGRTVTMTTKVDPALIGGVVARIGSTVYDGSVVTQLAAIRESLTARNRA